MKDVRRAHVEDLKAVNEDLESLEERLVPLKEEHGQKSNLLEEKRNELEGHQDTISKSDTELNTLQKEVLELGVDISRKEEKVHALKLERDRTACHGSG
jgi:chromosome segregation ATPase